MGKFIAYDGKIMLPFQIVGVKFYEKEEISLNSFQNFLLEAIEQGSNIQQIVEATLLTQNVIDTEIIQMIRQKLLVKENGSILLSDLSKRILMVSRCVEKLNAEHKKVCINLIHGDIEEYDAEIIKTIKDDSAFCLAPSISERDIDGISVEENISFFGSYMDTFCEMDKEQIESVLEFVYIEFDLAERDKGYKSYPISFLPCILHPDGANAILSSEHDDIIKARGRIYKICYSVKSEIVDTYKDVISSLIQVEQMDEEMISEKGKNVIQKYKQLKEYEQKNLVCYFDTVSGFWQFLQPSIGQGKQVKANMELPVLCTMSFDLKESLLQKLKEYFSVPQDLIVCEKSCLSEEYIVEFSLKELKGKDND